MTRPQLITPVPMWRQIADYLRDEILSGQFAPGQPLPSEETLSAEFNVSRPTVRQGTAALVREGLLTVRRPYGTVVRDPHARPARTEHRGLTATAGSYAESSAPGWVDVDKPVHVRQDATVAYAALLGIAPGEPMAVREVLQEADGGLRRAVRLLVPFGVLANHSVSWAKDGTIPAPESLYAWLAEHGHQLRFTEFVRARMPMGDETAALRMATGVPLLVVSRLVGDGDALALEEFRIPGDQAELAYPLPVAAERRRANGKGASRAKHQPAR